MSTNPCDTCEQYLIVRMHMEAVEIERDALDQERQIWGPRYNEATRRLFEAEQRIDELLAAIRAYLNAVAAGASGEEREAAAAALGAVASWKSPLAEAT